MQTLPPGVVGRLTQCLGGSLNLPRNGMFFDQLAKAAGCDEVPIATLARVAKPQFSGRRLFKAELREMHAVLVRALGEGSAEGQGAMQVQVQAHEAPKEALKEVPKEVPKQALRDVEQENRKQARKEALKPAVSEVGNGTSDVAIVTDRPAAVSKQEPAKQEEGRPAVALSIDSPSPYIVIRELPRHGSRPFSHSPLFPSIIGYGCLLVSPRVPHAASAPGALPALSARHRAVCTGVCPSSRRGGSCV